MSYSDIKELGKEIYGYYSSVAEPNRHHVRLMDDMEQVKNVLYRLEQSVSTIKNVIQPMYPSYPICTIKEAEKIIELVKSRIEKYSTKDYMNNINRLAFSSSVLDSITRDLRVISFGLQALIVDLQMFHIFLTNRPYMDEKQQQETLKKIDKQCQERQKDQKDIELKDILDKLKKEFKTITKRTLHVPSRMKRAYTKGLRQTRKRDILRTIRDSKPDVVDVSNSKYIPLLPYVEEQIHPKSPSPSPSRSKSKSKSKSRTKTRSRTKSKSRSNSNSNSSRSRYRSRTRKSSKSNKKSKANTNKSKSKNSKGKSRLEKRRTRYKLKM